MSFLNPTLFRCLVTTSIVAGITITIQAQSPELPLPPGSGEFAIPSDDQDSQSEILTRGPVHEAFAEQYVSDPQPGLIVEQAPPELIDELPPEEMPEGENVEWIPGYWAFDEDLNDFIWISGFWRDIPLGQRWVPGYWDEVPEGYQWVSGFWTSTDGDLAYLPQPPESLEQGPNVAPPGGDHFWVPGMWVYNNYEYRWRPGYYTPSRGDFVWIPARYRWTPRGYVFCSGYWDYPLVRRGTLFSPVYFRQHRFPRRYRPRYTVTFEPLLIHLFARPRYCHYYFGDYYANRYRDRGIVPFTRINTFGNRRYFHDPLFAYYRMPTRQNTFDRLVNWNRYFDRNTELRPPRTLNATQQFARGKDRGQAGVKQSIVSVSIDELRRSDRNSGKSFRSISEETRNKISQEAKESVRKLTESRVRFEARRDDEKPDQKEKPKLSDRSLRDDRAERLDSFRLPETSTLQSRSRNNLSGQQKDAVQRLRDQYGSRFDTAPRDHKDLSSRLELKRTPDVKTPRRDGPDSPKLESNPSSDRSSLRERFLDARPDFTPKTLRQRGGESDRLSSSKSDNGSTKQILTPRDRNDVSSRLDLKRTPDVKTPRRAEPDLPKPFEFNPRSDRGTSNDRLRDSRPDMTPKALRERSEQFDRLRPSSNSDSRSTKQTFTLRKLGPGSLRSNSNSGEKKSSSSRSRSSSKKSGSKSKKK